MILTLYLVNMYQIIVWLVNNINKLLVYYITGVTSV